MSEKLFEKLNNYKNEGKVPFYMPGHKGGGFDEIEALSLVAKMDITEIDGFDDLAHPEGVIKSTEDNIARLYGSKWSKISTNGSTCPLIASICALSNIARRQGANKIAIARNCHKSVYHGVEISGMQPVYILPDIISGSECYGSISPQIVKRLFDENPSLAGLVLTSPTYEGVISNIEEIAEIVHSHGGYLIVDEAHGAHLKFMYPNEKMSAIDMGGDIVIHSLHKTMSTLTQSAVLHFCTSSPELESELIRQMGIFNTSSPSYPIMASIDHCMHQLTSHPEVFLKLKDTVESFKNAVFGMEGIEILAKRKGVFALDGSKITVFTPNAHLYCQKLREFGIECEYSDKNHFIAMTGQGTCRSHLDALLSAMQSISTTGQQCNAVTILNDLPPVALTPAQAVVMPHQSIPTHLAVGEISADYLWLYPPGIPFLVPGEVITSRVVEIINHYKNSIINPACRDFDGNTLEIVHTVQKNRN